MCFCDRLLFKKEVEKSWSFKKTQSKGLSLGRWKAKLERQKDSSPRKLQYQ